MCPCGVMRDMSVQGTLCSYLCPELGVRRGEREKRQEGKENSCRDLYIIIKSSHLPHRP